LMPLHENRLSKRPTPFSGTFQNRQEPLGNIALGRWDVSTASLGLRSSFSFRISLFCQP
jgi:hypothetical protein